MKFLTHAVAAFFLFQKAATAQIDHCATDFLHQKRLAESRDFAQKMIDFEAFYLETMVKSPSLGGDRTVMTVPVVFHVIHQNGAENISDAQILEGLEHLNWAFANAEFYDKGSGTAVEIQFCLATQDTSGAATSGIVRVASGLTFHNYDTQEKELKKLSFWDSKRYVNIWIVREICGPTPASCAVAGYATLPGDHGKKTDGAVIEAQFVGGAPVFGVALAHEMGHYFGLLHTFQGGCANGNCLAQGDHICDTPPDKSTAGAACDQPPNTCATDADGANSPFLSDQNDMIQNFMDYGDWACQHDFTAGQAARMAFSLKNARKTLLVSTGCKPPCDAAVVANFSFPSSIVEVGATVVFKNLSQNFGASEWSINGQIVAATTDLTHQFLTFGEFEIMLAASGATENCQPHILTKKIKVLCPVVAAFLTLEPTLPIAGDSIFLKNTTPALPNLTFSWTTNLAGGAVSTAANFVLVPPAPGIFSVCLEAKNPFCSAQKCAFFNVFDPLAACNPNYLGLLGASASGGAGTTAQAADGSIFHINRLWQIQKLDKKGGIVEAWRLDTLPEAAVFRAIFDSDSMLVVGGQIGSKDAFLLRFDPKKGKIVWFRRFGSGQDCILDMLEKAPSGPFLVSMTEQFTLVGGLFGRAKILEIDRATGLVLKSFSLETANASQFRRLAAAGDGGFFAFGHSNTAKTGLTKTRAVLTKIDAAGEVVFSKTSFVDTSNWARLMGCDLAIDSAATVGLIFGSPNGTTFGGPSFWIQKTDLAGQLIWLKKISFPSQAGAFFYPQDIRVAADGYYVYGISAKAFLMKISKNGEKVDWAVQFASTTGANQPFSPGRLTVDGLDVLAVAASANASPPIFLNTDPLGLIAPACQETEPLIGQSEAVQNPVFQDLFLMKKANPTASQTILAAVVSLPPSAGFCPTCVRDCEAPPPLNVPPTDCSQPTFLMHFLKNPSKAVGFRGLKIGAADSSIWVVSTNLDGPELTKMDYLGQPKWSKSYQFDSNWPLQADYLFPTADSGALAFFDPFGQPTIAKLDTNGDAIWQKKTPTNTYLRAAAASKTGGGLAHFQHALGSSIAFVLQRFDENGASIWAKTYASDSIYFTAKKLLELQNGDWLAVGDGNSQVGGYAFAMRLGPDGSVVWQRLFQAGVYSYFDDAVELSGGDLMFFGRTYSLILGFQNWLVRTTAEGDGVFSKLLDQPANSIYSVQKMPKSDAVLALFGQKALKIEANGSVGWLRSGPFSAEDLAVLPDEKGIFWGGMGQVSCTGLTTFLFGRSDSLGTFGGCGGLELPAATRDTSLVSSAFLIETAEIPSPMIDAAAPEIEEKLPFQGVFTCSHLCKNDSLPPVEPPATLPCPFDLAVRIDSFACSGGATTAFLTVCNESDSTFLGEAVVGLFPNHPLKFSVAPALADTLALFLPSGACAHFSMKTAGKALDSEPFWAFLGEKSQFAWPIFSPIDTSKVLKNECRKPNNLFKKAFSPPAADVLALGADRVLCGQEVVELAAPSGFWSYRWSDGSTDSVFTASGEGLFWLEATDVCGAVQRDSVRVGFDPATLFDLPDLVICRPTEVVGPVGFSKIRWSPAEFLAPEKGPKTTVAPPDSSGFYTVRVVAETDAGCLASDTFRVENGIISFDLTVDPAADTLFLGNEIRLTAVPDSPFLSSVFWQWSPADGLDVLDEKSTTAKPLETTVFTVTATDAAGCTVSASSILTVTPCRDARFPNVFTPDGDGLNDFFDVFTEADCPCRVEKMEIFNRWGQLVFSKMGFENGEKTGWDGFFKAKPAAPDVYLFRVDLLFFDGTRLLKTGDLTLLR